MSQITRPQPGQVTITGHITAVLVVSQDQSQITGYIGSEPRVFDWKEGPPGRYESEAPPSHRVLGFGDDGTGVSTNDQEGGTIQWSQP